MANRFVCMALIMLGISFPHHSNAQAPSWTNDVGVSNVTDIYTGNQRPGVSSASFNGQIYVAYTSNTCGSGCMVKITSSIAPSTPASPGALNFTSPIYVSLPSGYAVSYNTPSLTVQNNYLYLAYNDASNTNWLTRSTDGVTWESPIQLAAGFQTTWAPSISNVGTAFYAGFANASSFQPIICTITIGTSLQNTVQSCTNISNASQMNFNPGLLSTGDVNAGVIIGYEWRGDQHCLSGYVIGPNNYLYDWMPSGNCGDQSSVAPSLTNYQSKLFIAWGSNNSNRQFNVRYSGSGYYLTTNKQTRPQGMNGSPNLLFFLPAPGNSGYGELVNFYAWNGQLRYFFGS